MKTNYKTIIVGAGISGLSLANELIAQGHPKDELLVVEAASRTGGLVRTSMVDGYTLEWGPEGLKGSSPNTKRVLSFIDAPIYSLDSTVPARYIVKKGKLRQVPHGPLSAIFTSLLSFPGKLRLLKEPFVKSKADEEETISEFVRRRFGGGILPVVEAVVSGVYGGSPDELSVNYAFPFLKMAEKQTGSVVKSGIKMMKMQRKQKKMMKAQGIVKEKDPFLMKPTGGMEAIINGLASNVEVVLDAPVSNVEKDDDVYKLSTAKGEFSTENLVIAAGVNGTSKIGILGHEPLEPVQESMVSIVSLSYDKDTFPLKYSGYGFLSPPEENSFVLGVLFTSQLFPGTAPDGKIVLSCFVGGVRHPERATMDHKELIEKTKADVHKLMKIDGVEPVFSEVTGHAPKGIPQILIGHGKVLQWRKQVEEASENLYLTGVGWKTISCDGVIGEAFEIAKKIIDKQVPTEMNIVAQ